MNDVSIKQLFKFFWVITAIVALVIIVTYFFLRWAIDVEKTEKKADQSTAAPEFDETPLTPQIIYDGRGFKPEKVLRDGSGSLACIVIVVNRSSYPLQIGLDPHNSVRDPGPEYPVIGPGDKLQFDPRFVGVKKVIFHNHTEPNKKFSVELGPACQI